MSTSISRRRWAWAARRTTRSPLSRCATPWTPPTPWSGTSFVELYIRSPRARPVQPEALPGDQGRDLPRCPGQRHQIAAGRVDHVPGRSGTSLAGPRRSPTRTTSRLAESIALARVSLGGGAPTRSCAISSADRVLNLPPEPRMGQVRRAVQGPEGERGITVTPGSSEAKTTGRPAWVRGRASSGKTTRIGSGRRRRTGPDLAECRRRTGLIAAAELIIVERAALT